MPKMTRLRESRPNWSVPKRCHPLSVGGWLMLSATMFGFSMIFTGSVNGISS